MRAGRLLGVITVDDVVDVIDEEAEDDLLKLSGVPDTDIYRAVLDTTRSRFSWLFVNLLTAILASGVISMFEATIEHIVALAVLMPIVASMGGNAGTQTLTVAVRALAMRELSEANALRVVTKEALVGTINGALFAVIVGVVAGLWFGDHLIGFVIGIAMIVNLFVAGLCGTLIPLGLARAEDRPGGGEHGLPHHRHRCGRLLRLPGAGGADPDVGQRRTDRSGNAYQTNVGKRRAGTGRGRGQKGFQPLRLRRFAPSGLEILAVHAARDQYGVDPGGAGAARSVARLSPTARMREWSAMPSNSKQRAYRSPKGRPQYSTSPPSSA